MVSSGRQILGLALAVIGFLGSITTCALPTWKVKALISANTGTVAVIWEGLWMNCVMYNTGQRTCKVYDSLLDLPQDLLASRALIIFAIIAGVFGILLGIAGCTNFVEDGKKKRRVAITSGVVLITAGMLLLIPVCWTTNTIFRDFYNPILTNAQRRELGASLYIGWGSAVLLLLSGVLCGCCLPRDEMEYNVHSKSTGQMQCKVYDSLLDLPQDLQAARALVIIAIIAGVFGILLGITGGKCTNFEEDERQKCKVAIASGIFFLIAGLLVLIPVCWTTNTIIRNFYNPLMIDAQRRELGASLYIKWGSVGLLFLGGGLLCSSCPPRDEKESLCFTSFSFCYTNTFCIHC
ncbi:hypothetical protein L3Q82_006523 [Scortum barcoo]|uniref:Uncharacterized protein n=1 Tax=Scortum barcoo TaxID=214431 RepID=A0ACB8WZQ6_9TELE|nr:hypothetical protein L3Q82_006523 [Scortum barcoo]